MIRTKPISNITKIDLDQIDCIIFVSKNGVKYFFEDSNSKKFNLSEKFFICIGEKTSKKLIEMGYNPSYTCSRNYAAEMSKELKKNNILISKNSLLIQGNLSSPSLYNSLSKDCKIQLIMKPLKPLMKIKKLMCWQVNPSRMLFSPVHQLLMHSVKYIIQIIFL